MTKVLADMARERWVIVLQTPTCQFGITVPREVGDDFLDFSTVEAAGILQAKVKSGLELGEKGTSPN